MKIAPLSIKMLQVYTLAILFFTASSMLNVFFPLQAKSEAMKVSEIGVVMGVYMLVCMVVRPYAGQLVTKYSPYTIMKYLLIVHAVTLLIYAYFTLDAIYVIRILQGVTTAFFSMAIQQTIIKVLSDENRGQGMSMYSLASVVPSLYGPAVALILWYGDQWLIPVIAIVLALTPLLCFYKSPFPKEKQSVVSFSLKSMVRTASLIIQHPILVMALMIIFVNAFIFSAIGTYLPLYTENSGAGNPALYLFLQAAVIVTSRFTLRKKIPSDGKWHPMFMIVVLLCCVLGVVFLLNSVTFYIAAIFNGIASAMLYPTLTTYISFVDAGELKGMLMGVFLVWYDLGFALGSMATGFIVEYSSYTMMFLTCSGLATICILGVILFKDRQFSNELQNK